MTHPDIFMDDFARDDEADRYFAALGRATSFAARFEGDVCALVGLLGIKSRLDLVLESPDAFNELYMQLYHRALFQQIEKIGVVDAQLKKDLHCGRKARNL